MSHLHSGWTALHTHTYTHTYTKPSPLDTSESFNFLSCPSLNCCLFHLLAKLVTGLQSPGHKAPRGSLLSWSLCCQTCSACMLAHRSASKGGKREAFRAESPPQVLRQGSGGSWPWMCCCPGGCPWPLLSLPLMRWLRPPTTAGDWSGGY